MGFFSSPKSTNNKSLKWMYRMNRLAVILFILALIYWLFKYL